MTRALGAASNSRASRWMALSLLGFSWSGLACGSRDEPRGGTPGEPETSPTWEVLTDPESLDTLCRLVGVSTLDMLGGADDCQVFVEQCRDATSILSALATGSGPAADSDVDLEPLLDCSVTAGQLDACLAGVLERGLVAVGEDVSCNSPELPEIDPASLILVPDCLVVALRCPDLIGGVGL